MGAGRRRAWIPNLPITMTRSNMIGLEFYKREMLKLMAPMIEDNRRLEAALRAFLDEHPGVRPADLRIEYTDRWRSPMPWRIRLVTPSERWLDWLSDNHGWSRCSEGSDED